MADINLNLNSGDLERAIKVIQKAFESLRKTIKKTGTTFKKDALSAKEFAKAIKQIKSEKSKLDIIQREELRLKRALILTEARISLATSKTNRKLIERKKQLLEINRQLRTGSKNTASWGTALGSFQFKFNALGNIAANVTSRISRGFTQAMRGAVKVIVDFELAMAGVKAITGATGKEFDKLRDSAKALAGITQFTASEVAALQKQYAKLGFSTTEILAAQAATLDLAAATGEDLARSAEIAGATLRGFRLRASESKRVVDLMARSFTRSALDLDRFAESMKFVAPIAAQANVSIEETTALLALMADAGIHGSRAGTALRVIFGQLSGEGENLADQLRILAKEGLSLAGAEDEVGRRAQTALLVLLDQIEALPELTKAFEDAGGAAQEMADIQLNTIAKQAGIVRSAWEGMILEISESETEFREIKSTLNFVTDFLNAIANMSKTELRFKDQFLIERTARKTIEDILENYRFTMSDAKSGFKGLGDTIKKIGKDIWGQLFPKKDIIEVDDFLPDIAEFKDAVKSIWKIITDEELDEAMNLNDLLNDLFVESTKDRNERIRAENLKLRKQSREDRDEELKEEKAAAKESIRIAQDKADAKRDIQDAAFNFAHTLLGVLSSRNRAALDKDLKAAEDNEEKTEQLKREFAKKEQKIALASAVMNQAEAITQIWSKWADNPVVAGILTGVALATLGGQIAIIKNQKFAEGGWVDGKSHSRGGTQIEAERGEYVIRKRSASKYSDLIEAINQDDQLRIMNAMHRDRKITINGGADPYNKKIYELMQKQAAYGEDNDYYYKEFGNTIIKTRKN